MKKVLHHKYLVAGVDLSTLRNRTEEHVLACLRALLADKDAADTEYVVEHAYAYALNQLPPLYPPQGETAPADPVSAWDIRGVVEKAIHHVRNHPKE
jgi:hypothetical protein